MSLSVCLIVRDEEAVIARCLNCVSKFADEIIIVDTGSADGTVKEAEKFTDEIYFFKWCGDFSAARNFAIEKAGCDYVMWLDADDVVTDENCKKIRGLVENGGFDMAFLPYAAGFDNGVPSMIYYRERIFKRSKNYRFHGAVHEAVAPEGKIVYSDAEIHHKKVKEGDPLRNLSIYQNQIARGICLDERSFFYYGRELLYCGMYRESIAVLNHFLTLDGWKENRLEACVDLYRAYSALGDIPNAYSSLFKALLIAPPTSEICCILGGHFFAENDVNSAIYWYQCALTCENRAKYGGFVNVDYCGYIPYLQLCVLYDGLGETKLANEYNEKAGAIKPNGSEYLYNKNYFKSKLNIEVL
ncbi:MAG: glycosyltransferase family 2 protein [Clostridia bacterium]|nr:glycosyltransferase family 2 protein [Clostridia bacterium]